MSLQYRTILSIATFWAERLGLELCPKHSLEKLAQDSEMISSLSAERERLEDKLKGAAIREKLLIEEKVRMLSFHLEEREEWFSEAISLDLNLTLYKRLLAVCICFYPLALVLGFYLGKGIGV